MRRQDKPQREPRTLAQQLGAGRLIECMRCEHSKPEAGSRRFRALHVCADCCAQLDKLNNREAA